MLRSSFTALVLCMLTAFSVNAQNFELGVFGGVAHYNGELTPSRITTELNESFGVFGRYNFNSHFAFRGGITYGRLSGADANHTSPDLVARNLSFQSNVYEFGFIGEYNLFGLDKYMPFSPYLFAGVAVFHHNPQAELNGTWVDLQPLGTEGQGTAAYPDRRPYSLWQVSIPFGAGVKIQFAEKVTLGLEAGLRRTFTDYLDDVSTTYVDRSILANESGQLAVRLMDRSGEIMSDPPLRREGSIRGNPDVQDYYAFMGATLSFKLGRTGRFRGVQYGCPGKF